MAETETLTDTNLPPESAPAPPSREITLPPTTVLPSGDWRTSLPDEIRGEKALADFKDVGSLAKSYVETKRLVGDAVKIPKPDATPEEKTAFYRKLGVPESPDKYDVKLPDLPAGHPTWQPEMVAGFKGAAHQAGLTPAQVQAVIGWYAANSIQTRDVSTATQARAQQVEQAQAIAALEKEWGPKDGPTWKRQLALARNTVRQLFNDDPKLAELAEMRGNDPVWVKGLAHIGEQMLEHGYLEGDAPAEVDKEDLSRRIAATRTEMATTNAGSRRYGELKEHLDSLYKQRYTGVR